MAKLDNLLGESESFLAILDDVSRLAKLNRPILIIGERGTGKELIAKRLHYLSKRWDQALITINCAALSEGVLDSELFGHEAGSFTGAKRRHQGRFERAQHGSLFLDELANSPLAVQEKLLRVIEYGEYERVGGNQTCFADVRLICATNADLPEMVEKGKFRADLLDRLAFEVIHIPPLRERKEDILLLAEHFAINLCQELDRDYFPGFTLLAKQQLLSHHWSGNVRELKNVVERSLFRHEPEQMVETITINPFNSSNPVPQANALSTNILNADILKTNSPDLSPEKTVMNDDSTRIKTSHTYPHSLSYQQPELPIDLKKHIQQQEIELIKFALNEARYNQRIAAESLGLSYHQLRGLLRKHQLVGDGNSDS
ncbi:phage shock protein operon transcriptional activator [Vibrio sp. SS-MA-C1-2]|uniref:phage shock protein operon transcriptional activator n=1 Tax=Vibrio sp. SS-MA-C1-2 TaxID=2908646 RepID=UPI001F026C1C|nr:phage shock protein operon transcriptional activator [Vibrio sp. SS-MA-C1-2]UJF19982.1 phage shock protein operon transcriptional activator [Vibrio sp. SS-MA-C1-2]